MEAELAGLRADLEATKMALKASTRRLALFEQPTGAGTRVLGRFLQEGTLPTWYSGTVVAAGDAFDGGAPRVYTVDFDDGERHEAFDADDLCPLRPLQDDAGFAMRR